MFSLNSTERVFSEAIKRHVSNDSKFLVAFSGGCDSLALLTLCSKVFGSGRTVPVYVNHNIRPADELEKEIALNHKNCRKLGVDLIVRTLDEGKVKALAARRGGGIEDAARVLRYEALEQERCKNGCSLILTAHHRDDQVETVVMHLRSGSPVTSLLGIREYDAARNLLRPLLGISRKELEQYLVSNGLEWSTDSTNSDGRYSRNDIRCNIIPKVAEVWPGFEDAVLALRSQAMDACNGEKKPDVSGNRVSLEDLKGRSLTGRVLAVYALWDHLFDGRELPMTLLDRVLDAISEGRDCNVGSNMAVFSLYRGYLYLTDPCEDSIYEKFEATIDPKLSQTVLLPGNMALRSEDDAQKALKTMENPDLALRLDPQKFKGKVRIRFVREGDVIRLKDGSKTVLRLLQDMKVMPALRRRVPVIEDEREVCAVFGSVLGGKDRICVKFVTSLARNNFPIYIVNSIESKG